jgi:hypothetical protein
MSQPSVLRLPYNPVALSNAPGEIMANEAASNAPSPAEGLREAWEEEVQAARELLEFAIATGREAKGGRGLSDSALTALHAAEHTLYEGKSPSPEQRLAFECAYRELALFTAPVTAETLRATSDDYGRRIWLLTWGKRLSEAKIWSRKLWIITAVLVLMVLAEDILDQFSTQLLSDRLEAMSVQAPRLVLQILVPFTYGGIGACAHLLRICHEYIHRREFDPLRIPEYYNRILLGIVSGGAVSLFIKELAVNDNGGVAYLSSAALGFLAGYNTELLFTTGERMIAAFFPKADVELGHRAPPPPVPAVSLLEGLTLRDLLDRRDKAETEPDRQFYEDLIARLKDRI